MNTGRFVGSRGKNSGARLEDTITKNNLEAVKEVVRQLRLRDIGGIIVIDFIDMANPKNRATVEEALRTELERDRTKTYVVEISPLGLVEMTRQNVTDGPRELMTQKCPTCGGDGIVYSEASAAIDVERRLRALVAGSRSQAYRVELAAPIAAALIGPGARRLQELEALTKRRFFLDGKPDMHADHFVVLAEGKLADLAPAAPVAEGAELQLELVEVDRHDGDAAVGKVDGFDVCVADAASLVGKRVKVRVERVLDGVAYATLVRSAKKAPEPLTAEAEAEKPTRKPPARKGTGAQAGTVEAVDDEEALEDEDADEPEDVDIDVEDEADEDVGEAETTPGRHGAGEEEDAPRLARRQEPEEAGGEAGGGAAEPAADAEAESPSAEPEAPKKRVTIHLPADDLGRRRRTRGGSEPRGRGGARRAPRPRTARPRPGEEEDAARLARRQEPPQAHGGRGRRRRTAPSRADGAEPEIAELEAPSRAAEPSRRGAVDERRPPRTTGATCRCPSGSTSSRAEFATLAPPAGPSGPRFPRL